MLLSVVLLILAAVLIVKNTPTNRRMSDADYFGSMEEDEAALVLDSEMVPERAIVKDDAVYLPDPVFMLCCHSLTPKVILNLL